MSRTIDIAGQKFGRLTCIEQVGVNKNRVSKWLCKCDCGNLKVVLGTSLRNGNTQSCGCMQKEKAIRNGENRVKHSFGKNNLTNSGVYKSWSHMKQRCLNPNNQDYPNYGGRGIKICKEWLEFENFLQWALSNGFQVGLSVERINNNGNYEPKNCCWATRKKQNNNKRNNRLIKYKSETKSLAQWSEVLGINYQTLHDRFRRGMSAEEAFTIPVRKRIES